MKTCGDDMMMDVWQGKREKRCDQRVWRADAAVGDETEEREMRKKNAQKEEGV